MVGKSELMDLVWPRLVVEEKPAGAGDGAAQAAGDHGHCHGAGTGLPVHAPVAVEGAPVMASNDAPDSASAPAPEPHPAKTNLPARVPPLIGRDEDLAAWPG